MQIIVVDDASEDVPALQEVVREFGRVELVLNDEAKGAGNARNVGLRHVKGDWLVFADADDFFSENLLDVLDKHYKDDLDIVYFRAESIFSDTLAHAPKLDERNAAINKYIGTKKISEFCRYYCTEPWGKMIKTDLVTRHGIGFDETPLANDFYFSVVSAFYARKVGLDDARLYMYTVRPESLSYRLCADESALTTRLNVYWGVQIFYDEHKVPYIPFYEFVISGLFLSRDVPKEVITLFLRKRKVSKMQALFRYAKGKLYQYTKGVHL